MSGKNCKSKTKVSKYGKKKGGGDEEEEQIKKVEKEADAAYVNTKNKKQVLEEAKKKLEEKTKIVEEEKSTLLKQKVSNGTQLINTDAKEQAIKNLPSTIKVKLNRYLESKKEAEEAVDKAQLEVNNAEDEYDKLSNESNALQKANGEEAQKKAALEENAALKAQKNADEGIYSFDDDYEVCCFSDLEGNMPKEIKALMFDNQFNYLLLYQHKRAIVFTGDLIDRGPYCIRNLLVMLNLKKFNKLNVILACGNRDLNKIRMYHECCIKSIEDRIIDIKKGHRNPDISIIDIINILKNMDKIEFFNSMETIAKNINIKGIVTDKKDIKALNNGTVDEAFKLSYSDEIDRIPKMYLHTLGSPDQIEFFKEEYIGLFNLNKTIFDEDITLLYKFIAMMNMVMGKIWSNLPDVLRPYNGLYIKYLEKCHIIASITIGDKLCFASHSGVPYYNNKEGHVSRFYIPNEIGIENKYVSRDNPENIRTLNKHFNNFIANIETFDYKSDEFKRYITVTAGCEETVRPYTSNASPIVSSVNLTLIQDKSNKSLEFLEIYKEDRVVAKIYNIFGHQPSGFLPYINKVPTVHGNAISYHIDLDISKAENTGGISNKMSFVYLKITKDNDRLYGKTVTTLKYNAVKKNHSQDDVNNIIHLEKIADKEKITIVYSKDVSKVVSKDVSEDVRKDGIDLDEYCKDGNQINAIYDDIPIVIFTVDCSKYYGINAKYSLVEYDKKASSSPIGGRAIKKKYAKSAKRFMNGKKQMVIYLGKRGGEYLKVKGEYLSLAKYIKIANKKKPTKK